MPLGTTVIATFFANFSQISGIHHKWIISRLETVKAEVHNALSSYRFNDAALTLYKFTWNELCDWYLELIKPDMQAGGESQCVAQHTLWVVLRETIIMLHPIMPFITAEIWKALPGNLEQDISVQPFPASHPEWVDAKAANDMELVQGIISSVRTIRAELNIAPSLKLSVIIRPNNAEHETILQQNELVIKTLARLDNINLTHSGDTPKASASAVFDGNEVIVPLHGAIDFGVELARLDKEFVKLEKEYNMLSNKLRNESFLAKAPQELVERDRSRTNDLAEGMTKLDNLRQRFREAMAEQDSLN